MGSNRSVDDPKKEEFLTACEKEDEFLQLMRDDPVGINKQINQIRNDYILRNSDNTGFDPEKDSYQFPAPFLRFSTNKLLEYLRKDGTELAKLFGNSESPARKPLEDISEIKPVYEPILEGIVKKLEESEKHNYPYQTTIEAMIEYTNVITIINNYKYLKTYITDHPNLGQYSVMDQSEGITSHYLLDKKYLDRGVLSDMKNKDIGENDRKKIENDIVNMCGIVYLIDDGADVPHLVGGIESMDNARKIIFGQSSSLESLDAQQKKLSSIDDLIVIPQFSPLDLSFFNAIRSGNLYVMGLLSPSTGYVNADEFNMAANTFAVHDITHAAQQTQIPKLRHEQPWEKLGHTEKMELNENIKNKLNKVLNEKLFDDYAGFDEEEFKKIKLDVNEDDNKYLSNKLARFGLNLDKAKELANDCDDLDDFKCRAKARGIEYCNLLLFVLLHETAINYSNIDALSNNSLTIPNDFIEKLDPVLKENKFPEELTIHAEANLRILLLVMQNENRKIKDKTTDDTESRTREIFERIDDINIDYSSRYYTDHDKILMLVELMNMGKIGIFVDLIKDYPKIIYAKTEQGDTILDFVDYHRRNNVYANFIVDMIAHDDTDTPLYGDRSVKRLHLLSESVIYYIDNHSLVKANTLANKLDSELLKLKERLSRYPNNNSEHLKQKLKKLESDIKELEDSLHTSKMRLQQTNAGQNNQDQLPNNGKRTMLFYSSSKSKDTKTHASSTSDGAKQGQPRSTK